jgi:NADPH:quinone reductase-like Zn-dependent oxidoreductase
MQAAGIDAFGGEVRVLKLAAPASPAPDEVVISVRAAGVGNWDEIVRVGGWDVGRRPPLALGVEAAGVVAAVGEDVTSLAPGDEVLTHPLPLRHQGAWAERLVAPAALVARKPTALSWAVAAAFPVPALTADQALTEAAPVPAGEWVLVHGASGVTGGLAVRLAVARGATVVATAGPSSAARIRDDGARAVFDYHDPAWPTLVRNATPGGRGVDAVVNAARGGAAIALQTVADGGHLATITGDPPLPERGVMVANIYVRADGARLAALVAALADGLLSLHVGATFPLAEAATALHGAVTGHAAGATVLTLEVGTIEPPRRRPSEVEAPTSGGSIEAATSGGSAEAVPKMSLRRASPRLPRCRRRGPPGHTPRSRRGALDNEVDLPVGTSMDPLHPRRPMSSTMRTSTARAGRPKPCSAAKRSPASTPAFDGAEAWILELPR